MGVVVLLLMIIPSLIAILFILEAMARATAIEFPDDLLATTDLGNVGAKKRKFWSRSSHTRLSNGQMVVGNRKYELTELCDIFMGHSGKLAYTVVSHVHL